MGFGAMGMTSWLLGTVAVVTVWGGLWWLLSTIGFHRTTHGPSAGVAELPTRLDNAAVATWEQPAFDDPDPLPSQGSTDVRAPASARTPPLPRPEPESDYR
jgi:hypothetical protein